MHLNHTFRFLLFSLMLVILVPAHGEPSELRILVTIRPVHSLVAGVTSPLIEPDLLIEQMQSPHDYHLKPSDIKKIQQADIIIYAGPQIESFLPGVLERLPHRQIIALSEIPGMTLYEGRALTHHQHGHADEEHNFDGHLWLSTDNAKVFVTYLSDILIRLDADRAEQYRTSTLALQQRLDKLHSDINSRLQPVRDVPFIQFHDAFQYFEKEFGLNRGQFFTTGTEHKIGAKQLRAVRQQVSEQNIRCIFYEPPVIPAILDNLIIPNQTRLLPLEPIGNELTTGADLYFQLMDNIAGQLDVCLKNGK